MLGICEITEFEVDGVEGVLRALKQIRAPVDHLALEGSRNYPKSLDPGGALLSWGLRLLGWPKKW